MIQSLSQHYYRTVLLTASAEARVWDEDVRNAAAIIRDIRSLKEFSPSPTWLNDFKCRHNFATDPNDGSIVSNARARAEEDAIE